MCGKLPHPTTAATELLETPMSENTVVNPSVETLTSTETSIETQTTTETETMTATDTQTETVTETTTETHTLTETVTETSTETQTVTDIQTMTDTETPTETQTTTETVTVTETATETQTQTATVTETATETQTATETETAPTVEAPTEEKKEEAKPGIWDRLCGMVKVVLAPVAQYAVTVTCGAGIVALTLGLFGMTTLAAIFGGIAVVGLGMYIARTFSEGFRSFFGISKKASKKAETKKD